MRLMDVFGMAIKSFTSNRSRSFLTVLGLSIGVGACIAIGSLGTAAVEEVQREVGRFGVDRIWISDMPGNAKQLEQEDALALTGISSQVSAVRYDAALATAGTKSAACGLVATTQGYRDIENFSMHEGRFLRQEDETYALRSIVLEDIMSEKLFGNGKAAVGEQVTVGDTRYTVVGVIKTVYSTFASQENAQGKAYIPLVVYQQLTGDSSVDEIVLRTDLGAYQAAKDVKTTLSQRNVGAQYLVTSMADQIQSAQRIVNIFVLVLTTIGVICMITGGVGVMNVLLTCVRERKREIGIRKAVGALDLEIFYQFLCEAFLYGAVGAVVGMLMGYGFTLAGSSIIGIAASPVGWVVAVSVTFSCAVGVLCGVYPAMRASGVSPVVAMRQI